MKIAYLSTFYPYRGGITHFNTSLLKALQNKNEVRPYTFKRQYPDLLFPGKTQFVTAEDRAEVINADRLLDTVNPLSFRKTAKKVSLFKPDILIMKYWMPFFGPSLGYVASKVKKGGCKVISILDNVIPHERKIFDIPFTRYFLNNNDGFVVMSETVKTDLLSLKPEAKYISHPHPLYDHFGELLDKKTAREKLNVPQDKKVLLFFGFIRDYKGLDILIDSMSHLPDDYFLIIAGEVYGNERKYHEQIAELKLQDKIQANFRYISDEEVALFFSAADVNVLPYRSATQSGILAIAYHFELPVIVTDTGSLREAVEPYHTGLVIPTPDSGILSAAIRDYFNIESQQEYIAAIKDYKKAHSWDKLAEAITQFYSSI